MLRIHGKQHIIDGVIYLIVAMGPFGLENWFGGLVRAECVQCLLT
jgi:hypothetical protein